MQRSLAGRLIGSFAIILSLALAAVALYMDAYERRAAIRNLEENLAGEVAVLAEAVPAGALAAGDPVRIDAWADRTGGQLGLRVTVIAPDGAVLGDSWVGRDSLALLENHADRPEVRAALGGAVGRPVRRSASVGQEFVYVARAVPAAAADSAARGAVVRLARAVAPVREHVRDTLVALWLMAGGALVAGLVLALWRTRPVARRLRALEEVARRIGSGDLTARASEEGRDEITEVARMVNRMAAGLRSTLGRVEAERDMREEMLSAMTDGVVLLDAAGVVVHANQAVARALDRPAQPAPGERFTEWCRAPELDSFLAEGREARGPLRRELHVRGPSERTLDAVASRLAGGDMLLVVRDLSALRRLERVRQDFVANVSHELKTPLTSILGYAETLLDGGLEDADHRRGFVETIRDQAARLKAITDDLLVLAELDRPDAAFALGPVDLALLCRSVTTALVPRARKDGIALGCETPPTEVVVLGERVRLEQMLFNLLDNALKYTEEGRVDVRLEREGDQAVLVVEDTGPGIPETALSRIFERFYRVDAARSREVPGTGLGLSIVRHVVELHRGRVEVANRSPRGARFTVRLPLPD